MKLFPDVTFEQLYRCIPAIGSGCANIPHGYTVRVQVSNLLAVLEEICGS